MATEPRFYADSSALVKLVLLEAESPALSDYIEGRRILTSELALVEVARAEKLADPPSEALASAVPVLDRVELVSVTQDLLRSAAELTSRRLRSLDAIHLATAMSVGPDEFVAYDHRLLEAAETVGLRVTSPR